MNKVINKINIFNEQGSISLRLLVFIGISTVFVFLVFGFYIENSAKQHFIEQDTVELRTTTRVLKETIATSTKNQMELDKDLQVIMSAHPGLFVYIEDGTKKIQFSNLNDEQILSLIMQNNQINSTNLQRLETWESGINHIRVLITPEKIRQKQYNIIVGMNINFHQHFLEDFRFNLWIAAFVAYFITILISWLIIFYGLRPLRNISNSIKNITTEHLNQRLDLTSAPVELKELGLSFNKMINNIEDVFKRQSNFSADIAHELRTPISNLIAQSQFTLNKQRTMEEYTETLHSNLEEFKKMSKMVNDMLFLARSEQESIIKNTAFNLKTEISSLLEYFEVMAEEEQVNLLLAGDAPEILGDRLMLKRAISNLLNNAINYAKKQTEISIFLYQESNQSILEISNYINTPISKEQSTKLFDRFYRVDPSRQRKKEGSSGIGLPIVKSIIDAHKGKIDVKVNDEMITFIIMFPTKQ